jgi:hypothetical protein
MKIRKQHHGTFDNCARCQAYVRLGESFGNAEGYAKTTRKLHNAAINRQERESLLKDSGLTKVRGAMGGVYWE